MAEQSALAETQAGATSYTLPDGQGSIRALTTSSGALTDTYRYDAFGTVLSHQGATTSAYGYDSQRYDAATSLYALRARSYDPTTGRFLSRDPATSNTTDPAQLDRYVYAAANPVMLSDPSGMDIVGYAEQTQISAGFSQALVDFAVNIGLTYVRWIIYAALPEEEAAQVFGWIDGTVQILYDIRAVLNYIHEIQYFLGIYSGILNSLNNFSGPGGTGSPPSSLPSGPTDGGGVWAYRVQNPSDPYTERIAATANGGIAIRGKNMLYLSFVTSSHALYYAAKKGEPAYVIYFQVTMAFYQAMKELAVEQKDGRAYPGFPQLSDPTTSGDSVALGLPSDVFQWLIDSVIPGTVGTWKP